MCRAKLILFEHTTDNVNVSRRENSNEIRMHCSTSQLLISSICSLAMGNSHSRCNPQLMIGFQKRLQANCFLPSHHILVPPFEHINHLLGEGKICSNWKLIYITWKEIIVVGVREFRGCGGGVHGVLRSLDKERKVRSFEDG